MTSEILTAISGILGVISGVVLNHFLERSRRGETRILNRKIKIYSSLLVKLNTVFQDGDKNIFTDPSFERTIRVTLAKALSEARLIAGERLEVKLREYHDEAVLFWEDGKREDDDRMPRLVIEIEQLMREEIGQKRLH